MGVAGVMNINIFLLWLIKSREAVGSQGGSKITFLTFLFLFFSRNTFIFEFLC